MENTEIVKKMNECPRGTAKESVCANLNMGLIVLDKYAQSAMWLAKKSENPQIKFRSSNAAVATSFLFKQLNDKCVCGREMLCPEFSEECNADELAALFSQSIEDPAALENYVAEL